VILGTRLDSKALAMEAPPPTPVAFKRKDWNPSFWWLLCPTFGLILVFVSPALIVIAAPVFLACFILSIVTMAKGRVLSGVLMPALEALTDGYFVYIVEDASSGASPIARGVALRRIEQAGGVPVTALQVLLEFHCDWARNEHYGEVVRTLKAHSSVFGPAAKATAAPLDKPLPGS
jgi:hypothetical protein